MNDPSTLSEFPQDIRGLIEKQDWNSLLPQLLLFATKRWARYSSQDNLAGYDPADVVLDAIEKVFTGSRIWDPQKHPDFFEYLTSVIDSEIKNLRMSWHVRRILPTGAPNDEGYLNPLNVSDETPSSSPLKSILLKEKRLQEYTEAVDFIAYLQREPLLQNIVRCILFQEITKPLEIVSYLGITPKQFSNSRKKLQRRWEQFRKISSEGKA